MYFKMHSVTVTNNDEQTTAFLIRMYFLCPYEFQRNWCCCNKTIQGDNGDTESVEKMKSKHMVKLCPRLQIETVRRTSERVMEKISRSVETLLKEVGVNNHTSRNW